MGCGTGRFAARLLSENLPADASYVGCDLSRTMVDLATENLAIYSERARVIQSDGTVFFPLPDHSVDRVISTYVLDLLSEPDIEGFFREAHRVLKVGGKVCLVGLTKGATLLSHIVVAIWTLLFRLQASLVGGCRRISKWPCQLTLIVMQKMKKSLYIVHVLIFCGILQTVPVSNAEGQQMDWSSRYDFFRSHFKSLPQSEVVYCAMLLKEILNDLDEENQCSGDDSCVLLDQDPFGATVPFPKSLAFAMRAKMKEYCERCADGFSYSVKQDNLINKPVCFDGKCMVRTSFDRNRCEEGNDILMISK